MDVKIAAARSRNNKEENRDMLLFRVKIIRKKLTIYARNRAIEQWFEQPEQQLAALAIT